MLVCALNIDAPQTNAIAIAFMNTLNTTLRNGTLYFSIFQIRPTTQVFVRYSCQVRCLAVPSVVVWYPALQSYRQVHASFPSL
jgi:hypothetical protein